MDVSGVNIEEDLCECYLRVGTTTGVAVALSRGRAVAAVAAGHVGQMLMGKKSNVPFERGRWFLYRTDLFVICLDQHGILASEAASRWYRIVSPLCLNHLTQSNRLRSMGAYHNKSLIRPQKII